MIRRSILGWASALVRAFYWFVRTGREEAVVGPLLAVSNHTNGLVDGVVLIKASGRPLRVLVKHELLRIPGLGWIARGVAAVPVYRQKDQVPISWNDQSFHALDAALASREAIGVFPEGTSHLEAGIRPLKTGAARIALSAEDAAGWRLGVRILPVGIHYEDRDRFQSRVLIVVGEPVEVAPLRERHHDAEWDAVLELTAQIHGALQGVRMELEEAEARPLLAIVFDELRSGTLDERSAPARLQALAAGLQARRAADPAAAADTLARLCALDAARFPRGAARAFHIFQRAAGLLAWSLPALLSYLNTRLLPFPVDKRASVLLLSASVFFPIWLVVLTLLARRELGAFWALATPVLLVLLGLNALRAERAWKSRALPDEAARERAAIAEELCAAVRG